MRLAAVAAIAVAVIAVVALWRAGPAGTPKPTTPPSTAPAEHAATAVASPTITVAPSPGPPQPSAEPTSDVADPAGSPPPDADGTAAADLVDVRLGDAPAGGLTVTFELAGPPPASVDSLLWSLTVVEAGEPRFTISAQQLATQLVAGVYDWREGVQHALPEPVVVGSTVTLTVDGALVPGLERPFAWEALTQLHGGYEDRLPDVGTATYPS